MTIQLKRAYEPVAPGDGYRVLIDRLWPRGIRKTELQLDAWAKELAPSNELRRWYHHEPELWDEFRKRYRDELDGTAGAEETMADLVNRAREGTVTLVFSARDAEHSNAEALSELLEAKLRERAD